MNYIEDYIMALKGDKRSENTIRAYVNNVKSMLAYINKPVEEITRADIIRYKATLGEKSANTIHQHIASVKNYFDFLEDFGYIAKSPITKKIKMPRVNPKEKPEVTVDDVKALIANCGNVRNKAFIELTVSTGLRFSEVSSITMKDYKEAVNFRGEIIITGKGSKQRKIYIDEGVRKSVDEYLATRNDDCEYLFVSNQKTKLSDKSINNTLKRIATKANLPYAKDFSCHVLRSAFATIANANGVDAFTIQKALGHADINTTVRYARVGNGMVNNSIQHVAQCLGF